MTYAQWSYEAAIIREREDLEAEQTQALIRLIYRSAERSFHNTLVRVLGANIGARASKPKVVANETVQEQQRRLMKLATTSGMEVIEEEGGLLAPVEDSAAGDADASSTSSSATDISPSPATDPDDGFEPYLDFLPLIFTVGRADAVKSALDRDKEYEVSSGVGQDKAVAAADALLEAGDMTPIEDDVIESRQVSDTLRATLLAMGVIFDDERVLDNEVAPLESLETTTEETDG